jgi:hypothetical protein
MDFCVVENPEIKKKIRMPKRKKCYESRMSSDWLDDLKPLGTDWRKPFRNRSFLIISDEYMNLMAKKRKQLLRSRKCIAAGFCWRQYIK